MLAETELFEFPDLIPLDFVYGLGWRAKFTKRKVDTRDKLLAGIWDAAERIKQMEDQLRRKHAIFAYWLQSALRLTVGFSNIYWEKFVISV